MAHFPWKSCGQYWYEGCDCGFRKMLAVIIPVIYGPKKGFYCRMLTMIDLNTMGKGRSARYGQSRSGPLSSTKYNPSTPSGIEIVTP